MRIDISDEKARAYVTRHFWTPDALAAAVGVAWSRLQALIAAGVAPGAIYARDPAHGWWSALGGWVGDPDASHHYDEDAEIWLSPWTVWPLRRACLIGAGGAPDHLLAKAERDRFGLEFIDALSRVSAAPIAFPHCFTSSGKVHAEHAVRQAGEEWASWLDGGYAVCLRAFTGASCVKKESLGGLLKRHIADPVAWPMTPAESLDACAKLSALILPFAPWERPTGTPGRTIDVIVERFGLGAERPYD